MRSIDEPQAGQAAKSVLMLAHSVLRAACRVYPFIRGRGTIANLVGRYLQITPGTVCRLRNSGLEIELLPGQFGSVVTWLFGIDEPREVAFFRQSVRAGDVVIDVGANIGSTLL